MKLFVVNYKFLSCGDVFTNGFRNAARALNIEYMDFYWNDPNLQKEINTFSPDLLFVTHGRKFSQKWGTTFKKYNTAVWLVDEPYEVDDTERFSRYFNTVFLNDPSTLNRHANAHYLPVGYDSMMYHPNGNNRKYSTGFIGGFNQNRQKLLEGLYKSKLLSYVIGGPWKGSLYDICRSGNIPASKTIQYYQQTKIVINIFRQVHHFNRQRIPAYSMNPRIYEALACGCLVISEKRGEITGVLPELPVYENERDLAEKIRHFLSNIDSANRIINLCQARLRQGHTYIHRLKKIIDTCC